MKEIHAKFDNIIVEVIKEIETKTSGGIITPQSTFNMPQSYGRVVSIGPDSRDKEIVVGETIIFHRNGGQVVLTDNKEELRILKPGEIYGVVLF
jgi:co-chaperonin GroES (HSP10)